MRLNSLLLVIALFSSGDAVDGQGEAASSRLSQALAATPRSVSISIVQTGSASDGGSILNDLRFSDSRLYTLSLDFPLDVATNKVVYQDIHFKIFVLGEEPPHLETLEHGSGGERRLIELLETLIATTEDPHEKKNATSLVIFLRNRKQEFPAGNKWWDFTPRSLKYSPGQPDISERIRLVQLTIDAVNEELAARETKQNAQIIRTLRRRVDSLNKSLSAVRNTDPGAEKRVIEIDRELTSVLYKIVQIKGQK